MSIAALFADFRDYLDLRPEPELRDFVEGFDWSCTQRSLTPNTLPISRELAPAAQNSAGAEQRLLKSLLANVDKLTWGQSYTAADFGQSFIDNYGFVEMLGTRGHFDARDMAGGFFVMGPMQHYPSHHHVAEEIYIPLTDGSYWMRDNGAFERRARGEIIHHASNEAHAMETPDAPLVALYLWRNGDLAQKPDY